MYAKLLPKQEGNKIVGFRLLSGICLRLHSLGQPSPGTGAGTRPISGNCAAGRTDSRVLPRIWYQFQSEFTEFSRI